MKIREKLFLLSITCLLFLSACRTSGAHFHSGLSDSSTELLATLRKQYNDARIGIDFGCKQQGCTIMIEVINSPFRDLPLVDQWDKKREVAIFVKNNWSGISNYSDIQVCFYKEGTFNERMSSSGKRGERLVKDVHGEARVFLVSKLPDAPTHEQLEGLRNRLKEQYQTGSLHLEIEEGALMVHCINSPFNDLSKVEQAKKARELALFTKQHYALIKECNELEIGFREVRGTIFLFSSWYGYKERFNVAELKP